MGVRGRVWEALVEPRAAGSPVEDHHNRLLARLLLASLALGLVGLGWHILTVGGIDSSTVVGAVAVLVLVLAYVLARQGRFMIAAGLAIATAASAPVLALSFDRAAQAAPAFLVVPMLLAATVFPWRQAMIMVPAILAVGFGALLILATDPLQRDFATASSLALIAAGLLLVAVRHRCLLERSQRAALAESAANFQALAECASDGIVVVQDERIAFANGQTAALLGCGVEELPGRLVAELIHPDDRERALDYHRRRLAGKDAPMRYQLQLLTGNGVCLAEVSATRTWWGGRPAGLITVRDIGERAATEARMRTLSGALEQSAESVVITDHDGVIEYVNPAYERITGYAREEVLGRRPSILKSGRQSERFYRQLWDTITRGDVFNDVFVNRRKDGSYYYEEKTITPLKNADGEITHFIATGRDITDRVRTQERLEFLAHHDSLTELPNRVLFLDRLEQALARARWHQRLVAVIFLDVDRFKHINDSLGHDAGDALLRELAGRLRQILRGRDTIARLGGDEFGILLDDMAGPEDVEELADKILGSLREPFAVGARELFVTASIGVSLYPTDGDQAGVLLKHADIAMYRAKDLGKNTFQFYSAEMSVRAFERLTVETSLRRAMERNEWQLYFQPLVDCATGRTAGAEALLRWQHPDFGLLLPEEFVPVLEETGLIVSVGEWVLRQACRHAREFERTLAEPPWVTVNVSGRQLATGERFLDSLRRSLEDSGLEPSRLELEITESGLMFDAEHTLSTLDALDRMGVRLAIDDFGTGYSSLAYLKRFPIDTLKIDRTFVRDVPADEDDTAIVRSVLALGRSLRLEVIAEGVETEAQLELLRTEGCAMVQGFLLGAPMPVGEFRAALAARAP